MGLGETPDVDRIRGYDYVNGVWRAVAVDQSGQLGIFTTVHVDVIDAHISSGLVAILSGEIHVMSGVVDAQLLSGEIHVMSGLIGVESGEVHVMSGIQDVQVLSGQVHIMSGSISVESGVWVAGVSFSGLDIQVNISGDPVKISGEPVWISSGEIHVLSGIQDVQVLSGQIHVMSGIVDTQILSGQIHVMSGIQDVQILSGQVHIMSGFVDIGSGNIAAHVSGTVAVSGHVFVSGTVVAEASGEHVQVLGYDYVQQSGPGDVFSGYLVSGCVLPVTAVQVNNWVFQSGDNPIMTEPFEAFVPETRLFTGADNKHVRFEDVFDGNALDVGKWRLTATAVVTEQMVQLQDGGAASIIRTHNRYLYGILACKVYIQDPTDTDCRFGFTGDYTASTRDAEVEWVGSAGGPGAAGGRFHTEDTPQTGGGDTYTNVRLNADTWYNVQFVWTPEYAQIWIDGILRASHVTHVPQAPAYLYFRAASGKYLYVGNVSVTTYGDIPITKEGRVPVREQGAILRTWDTFIPTHQSGGVILGSGAIDRLIIKVPKISCSGEVLYGYVVNSGALHGMWVGGSLSGEYPYTGSGCVGSGKGLFLEPGDQKEFYVRDLGEISLVGETSGYPISYAAETMQKLAGRDVIY